MLKLPHARRLWFFTFAFVASILLSGCRRTEIVTPTPLPTSTPLPTPLSTALPTIEAQPTYGGDARPYQVSFVASGSQTGADFGRFLNDNAGFNFDIVRGKESADVLAALCSDVPTLAFADGWTLLAAQAQQCGRPILVYIQGTGSRAKTGTSVDLIVPATSQAANASGLKGLAYCRLNESDLVTWVLPVLLMRSTGNFDPFNDFVSIRDVPNMDTLVAEVAAGQCVGAVESGTLGDYEVSGARALQSSPELPFGGVIVSSRIPVAAAQRLTDLLLGNESELRGIADTDSLREPDTALIGDMLDFLRDAGFDMTVH
ncbi:MAG: PhnD/SsuA/transferrin family substrate-binding protein [Anaerolineae bacterium]|nr:PhnD/SsuA/transferrin family substrate-binding protein [Anaerolineae bacterium]